MTALDFPGHRTLVERIDAAMAAGDDQAITSALRNSLCRMIREREVELPACVLQAEDDHYARREIYQSPDLGYAVIAMTWGPGQGTPIHDHAGMWCVEGVWHGQLEITQYELLAREDDRFSFRPVGTLNAGTGSAGSLIPPHEYHTIRNPSEREVAVSLHIYKGPMSCCSVFEPLQSTWYRRGERVLRLDEAH